MVIDPRMVNACIQGLRTQAINRAISEARQNVACSLRCLQDHRRPLATITMPERIGALARLQIALDFGAITNAEFIVADELIRHTDKRPWWWSENLSK